MNTNGWPRHGAAVGLCAMVGSAALAAPIGKSFTFQGQLKSDSQPLTGTVQATFSLWNHPTSTVAGAKIGGDHTFAVLPVDRGLFTVALNTANQFGSTAFDGNERWLQVSINGQVLAPRQPIAAAPYAIQTRNLFVNDSGFLGVGTASPGVRLHVEGGSDTGLASGGFLQTGPSTGENLSFDTNELMARENGATSELYLNHQGGNVLISAAGTGNVGIGVTTPAARIDLAGSLRLRETGGFAIILSGNGEDNADTGIGHPANGEITLVSNNTERVRLTSNGHFGIGTDFPVAPLHIVDTSGNPQAILECSGGAGTWLSLRNTSPSGRFWNLISSGGSNGGGAGNLLFHDQTAGGGTRMTLDTNGRLGIGTTSPATTLDVNGTTTTKAIHITGGADIAEPFEIAASGEVLPMPGFVVAIDPEHIGRLRVADKAHDRTVAGIISGANGINPGLLLWQENTVAKGTFPVATMGRVWCWVDADEAGPVQAGDLLTTSNTAGHAMRVTDPALANGTVLGKAMSRLDSGKGLVLVLVSLQ